ncbi:hypothetical protein F4780DRAFT_786335 [Xylariomycetidae sp. FL0641]|nr:hypothetical protein F4780DRAFT_786335 [Xylariomycetidae sp. FL0641]
MGRPSFFLTKQVRAAETQLTLPYFAPHSELPAPLPTFEQIWHEVSLESEYADESPRTLLVGRHFFVKYGLTLDLTEAENLVFVQQNCGVPVPKLYAAYRDEETGVGVIVMEYIHGETLGSAFLTLHLSEGEWESIKAQLRDQLRELRAIAAPEWYGMLGRRPYNIDYWEENTSVDYAEGPLEITNTTGPFDSGKELLDAVWYRQMGTDAWGVPRAIREELHAEFSRIADETHDRSVFTHGELDARHIIIRDGTPVITAWENAGFYPAYWEAKASCRLSPRWEKMLYQLFDEDYKEEVDFLGTLHSRCLLAGWSFRP